MAIRKWQRETTLQLVPTLILKVCVKLTFSSLKFKIKMQKMREAIGNHFKIKTKLYLRKIV